jgi:hypothetical protein
MIKLINLLKEAEEKEEKSLTPQELGDLGFILGKPGEKELFKKGFILVDAGTDPETGAVTSKVVKLPAFTSFRKDLTNIKGNVQPFKQSSDEIIKKLATETVRELIKANNLIFQLEKAIELQKKS